jgi:hypothetical protein
MEKELEDMMKRFEILEKEPAVQEFLSLKGEKAYYTSRYHKFTTTRDVRFIDTSFFHRHGFKLFYR